ncbi:membrane protein DedA with SNARE-associated domain [Actinokineospora baliensis]|uniref:DedA family protein n=1 Tax=Actinokineospora baliensis TaxID=547056 RepID=UPI0019574FEC|nr:DedA family protein [Actinokineospora baliensis]MBM7774793.1 membrane protein DedA with SNARE-associated domain [Actinokineospora baliensis]
MADGALIDAVLPDVAGLPPAAVLATVFVVAFAETTLVVGVLLPGEVLIAACIGVLGTAWTPLAGAAAALGCLSGQLTGYAIGRALGPRLRESWIGRRTGRARWNRAESVVRRSGGWLLVTARFVAVLHTLAPALAGVLRMPARRFALFAALSSTAWAVLWATVGAAIGSLVDAQDRGLVTSLLVVAGIAIAAVVVGSAARMKLDEPDATASEEDDRDIGATED